MTLSPPPPLPTSITVQITQQPDGSYGLRAITAPGWAAIVRNPMQLANALARAFSETQIAAYSRRKNQRYDLDTIDPQDPFYEETDHIRRLHNNNGLRKDVYHIKYWRDSPDGYWISPSGRKYRKDSQLGQVITRKKSLENNN